MVDSHAFSNAIRLIDSILDRRKMVNGYDSEKGNTTHFIRKQRALALFLKNFVSGSSLHEFEMCYGCVFQ